LHLWHSNVIARISSKPTTILRSKVMLPECTTPKRCRAPSRLARRRSLCERQSRKSLLAPELPQGHTPLSWHRLQAVRHDCRRRSTGVEIAKGS
jgi:hypothetical protein